jgi:hypothetical protein
MYLLLELILRASISGKNMADFFSQNYEQKISRTFLSQNYEQKFPPKFEAKPSLD